MPDPATRAGSPRDSGDTDMSRTYLSVFIVWVLVLGALYAFQWYFTH